MLAVSLVQHGLPRGAVSIAAPVVDCVAAYLVLVGRLLPPPRAVPCFGKFFTNLPTSFVERDACPPTKFRRRGRRGYEERVHRILVTFATRSRFEHLGPASVVEILEGEYQLSYRSVQHL